MGSGILLGSRKRDDACNMKIDFKKAWNTALRWLGRMALRTRASMRRFRRGGGFPGLLKRTGQNLRRREPRTLVACACTALVIIAVPVLCFAAGGKRPAAAEAGDALPSGSPARVESAAASDYIDLSDQYTPKPSATPRPSPTPIPTPTPILLGKGATGAQVMAVQERLMELGYMDYDEPTEYYGSVTKEAVEMFQRRHGLTVDGYIGEETYDRLMREDALPYMVTVGDEGTDVKELQKRLVELDYMDKATGYFGDETAAAVKEFQDRNGLDVDGMIGMQTREMLYSEEAIAKSLSYGEKSDEVLKYQKRLYDLAYLTTEPDGTFGSDTLAAVKLFQELNGLIADGHIGPQTKAVLMSSDAQANALTIGMKGDTVKNVQKLLKQLGYLDSADGYFGSGTEAAVRAFQERNGLTVDGKVGRQTLTALRSDDAKKAAADTPAATSGPAATPKPSETSSPSSGTSNGASVDRFVEIALSKLGCPYRTGAKGPSSFDCSGFVYWCLNQAGVKQSYMTSKTWRSVTKYQKISSMSDIQKGDVLVFKMSSSKGHVGIATSSSKMVDASSGNGEVVHRSFQTDYWQKYFYCAYRIF